MARPSLSSMLPATEAETRTEQTEPAAAPAAATPKTKSKSRSQPTATSTPPDPRDEAGGPRYLELVRKEARLTDEQLQELATLTRQLNKARQGAGERLTDNTLIRVAVDLLLQGRDRLHGTTEAELRKSVGL